MTQIARKLESEEDKIAENQNQSQQQMMEAQKQQQELDRAFEKYKVDLNAQIAREKMMVDVAKNQDGYARDTDLNNNHVADDLERMRNELENRKIEYEKQFKQAQLQEEIRSNKANEKIKLIQAKKPNKTSK